MTTDDYKKYCEAVKIRFGGKCPYTDLKCDTFNCAFCAVEKEEMKWLEDLKNEDSE